MPVLIQRTHSFVTGFGPELVTRLDARLQTSCPLSESRTSRKRAPFSEATLRMLFTIVGVAVFFAQFASTS